jgi:hypothetical protein
MNRHALAFALLTLALGGGMAAFTAVGTGPMPMLQPDKAAELLRPGITTRADAERLLGAGRVLRADRGWTTTRYVDRGSLPRSLDFVPVVGLFTSALDTPETELVLLFDAQGLLRKFKLRRAG